MGRDLRFNLTKPCSDCPFKRDDSIKLRVGRMQGIIIDLIARDATFECHKTLDNDPGEHCAGAIIFLIKLDALWGNKMFRLAHMLRMMDVEQYKPDPNVYSSVEECMAGATDYNL